MCCNLQSANRHQVLLSWQSEFGFKLAAMDAVGIVVVVSSGDGNLKQSVSNINYYLVNHNLLEYY